jgi:integrase
LAQISNTNRGLMREYLLYKQAKGMRPTTLFLTALCFRSLDAYAKGKPFFELTPRELTAWLADMRTTHAPATCYTNAGMAKALWTWKHDGQVPLPIKRALAVEKPDPKERVRITETEFHALLFQASQLKNRVYAARATALLWTLWETGARISEVLSLRVVDFRPRDEETADLTMPTHAPGLKTGARNLFVAQCSPPLRVWLAMHPQRENGEAALLPNRDGVTRWLPKDVNALLRRFCKLAGLRTITCHDFRHTAATMKAEGGWVESQLCSYFGWSETSDMPRHYVHMARSQVEERVRRDAGLSDVNQRQKREAGEAVEALLRDVLSKMAREQR